MTNLSLAATAVLRAAGDSEPGIYATVSATLRSAADCLTDATSSHTLYAIADELEGMTYGTYRCELEAT